jgi:PEP-CTERM motif
MKNPRCTYSSVTKVSALVGSLLACHCAQATLLFSEAFNYNSGVNLGGQINPGNSTAWSGGNAVLSIGSGNLTYPGLQDQGGNDLIYTSGTASSTTYNTYSAVTSGSVYFSFLIDATTLPTANNYLMALNPGTSTPGGSSDALSLYVGASGTGYKIGVRTTGGGTGAAYASDVLALNSSYFIVAELTLGSPNTVSLFFDPTPGGSQPGTPDSTQTTSTAIASVDDIGFKAQSSAAAGDYAIDNLLIGTAWADVTPVAVPEPASFGFIGAGLIAAVYGRRLIKK